MQSFYSANQKPRNTKSMGGLNNGIVKDLKYRLYGQDPTISRNKPVKPIIYHKKVFSHDEVENRRSNLSQHRKILSSNPCLKPKIMKKNDYQTKVKTQIQYPKIIKTQSSQLTRNVSQKVNCDIFNKSPFDPSKHCKQLYTNTQASQKDRLFTELKGLADKQKEKI